MDRKKVTQMAKEYIAKPGNEAAGNLHIVLDDLNTESCHVHFCLELAEGEEDQDGVELAEALLKMSETQRNKIAHDCWKK